MALIWWNCGIQTFNGGAGSFQNATLNGINEAHAFGFTPMTSDAITHVGVRVGSVTGTGGAYDVGLQALDSSANPTGTFLSSGNAKGTLSTTVGWQWISLTSSYSPTLGEQLALVVDATTGTDGSNYCTLSYQESQMAEDFTIPGRKQNFGSGWSTNWSTTADCWGYKTASNVYGRPLDAGSVATSIAGTTGDKWGNVIQLPHPLTIYGFWLHLSRFNATTTVDAGIWDTGSPPSAVKVMTAHIDEDQVSTSPYATQVVFDTSIDLEADTEYLFGYEQNDTGDWEWQYYNVDVNADLAAYWPGINCYRSSYLSSTWTDYNTSRIPMSLLIDDSEFGPSGMGPRSNIISPTGRIF